MIMIITHLIMIIIIFIVIIVQNITLQFFTQPSLTERATHSVKAAKLRTAQMFHWGIWKITFFLLSFFHSPKPNSYVVITIQYILHTCMLLLELMITLCLKAENYYCVSLQSDDKLILKFTSHHPNYKISYCHQIILCTLST